VHNNLTRNLTSVIGRIKSPDIARLFCSHLIFTPQPRCQPRHAPVDTIFSRLLRPNHLFSSNCHEASPCVRGPIIETLPLHALPHCSPRTCIGQRTKENVEGLLMFHRSRRAYASSLPHTMAPFEAQGILAIGLSLE
jgi:hypothetical protein